VLNVTRNYETGHTTVELSASSDTSDSNEWYIYVTYATETNPVFTYDEPAYKTGWFKSSDTNYTFNADDVDDWIIINLRQTGRYRRTCHIFRSSLRSLLRGKIYAILRFRHDLSLKKNVA